MIAMLQLQGRILAQEKTDHTEEPVSKTLTSISDEPAKHQDLETELEIYPFNIIIPDDPVIKNEAMFDYHVFYKEDRFLGGIRFFADANTHWAKARNMQDLIIYTELYYGYKYFQIGLETGSVTNQEYLSWGPQFTHYDSPFFKRISLISRIFPDYVLGYEFTTQEADIFKKLRISSTGMSRIVLPTYQMVIQVSIWVSVKKIKGIYLGVEYEYNNAKYFNDFRFEKRNELFLGVKVELH